MRNYEALVIVDPRLDESSISQAVERFTGAIRAKGEVTKVETWGRRRLSYEIDHLSEGYYVLAKFRAEASLLEELDRLFKVGEEYVRAKVVRLP